MVQTGTLLNGTVTKRNKKVHCYKTAHYHKSIVLRIGWVLNLTYGNPGCGQPQPTELCQSMDWLAFNL
jgi:hypothetical protein